MVLEYVLCPGRNWSLKNEILINIEKSSVFIESSNEQLEIEIIKCTVYKSTQNMKYLGINLITCAKYIF